MGKHSYKLKIKNFVIFLFLYPNKMRTNQKLQQIMTSENGGDLLISFSLVVLVR